MNKNMHKGQRYGLKSILIISIICLYSIITIKNTYFLIPVDNIKLEENELEKLPLTNVNKTHKRIFCIILTQPKNLETKARAVNLTWARECDNYFFIARIDKNSTNVTIESTNPLPIIQPANYIQENYRKLTDKVYSTFKYIYSKYDNYDWYLKADDDTFIFMDNLRKFIENKNETNALTFGFDLKPTFKSKNISYHSGGAGYLLSNEAFSRIGKILNKNFTYCQNTGIEDVDVSTCLFKLGVKQEKSIDEFGRERFHPYDVNIHFNGLFNPWLLSAAKNKLKKGIDCCSETTISFHYMTPEKQFKMHTLWKYYNYINKNSILFNFNLTSILTQMIF